MPPDGVLTVHLPVMCGSGRAPKDAPPQDVREGVPDDGERLAGRDVAAADLANDQAGIPRAHRVRPLGETRHLAGVDVGADVATLARRAQEILLGHLRLRHRNGVLRAPQPRFLPPGEAEGPDTRRARTRRTSRSRDGRRRARAGRGPSSPCRRSARRACSRAASCPQWRSISGMKGMPSHRPSRSRVARISDFDLTVTSSPARRASVFGQSNPDASDPISYPSG
jgi:hypothetical protein